MKKTAKLLLFAAMAAVVFSCTKENQVNTDNNFPDGKNSEKVVVPATDGNSLTSFKYTLEGASTKVTVNISDGKTAVENGDEVLVFVASDNKAVYVFDSTNNRFNLKGGETAVELSAPASVFYPADEYDVEGGSVIFTMPAAIEASGDFGAINPMAGVIEGSEGAYEVLLCNLASVLRVQVTADVNINSVKLDYGTGVNYASGAKFTVDASAKTMTLSSGSVNTYETVALGTPAASADVLFIIPTLDLGNGLTATANLASNHNGGANSFSVTNSSTTARSRNKISTMSFYAGLFSGGAGVDGDPYLIANARDFKNLQKYTVEGYTPGSKTTDNFLSAYYQQTADIDAGTVTPIGTSSEPFAGEYDGQGNELNVTISTSTDNTGVFGYIQNATVKNLTVKGSVESSGMYTAGIAGQMDGSSKISGCTNMATINNTNDSNAYAAGIVGRARGASEIVLCANEGEITATKAFAAGIVGDMTGTIDKCVNKNTVTGGANTGGIAGALRASSTIRRCYSSKSKEIKGTNRVGGIVGYQVAGTVANCFSNSNVTITANTADYGAGGLVGILGGLLFNSATGDITVKCSASCTDKNKAVVNVGGLVGRQTGGTIQNVYSPLYAKDIKIGTIHGRSGSGKIGQIVGVITTSGSLCAYYFGGCATETTGWQYWGTNEDSTNANRDGQWAFTSANNVSMDWTAPVAKDFSGFGQSLASGEYHLKDVLNIDKSSSAKYSAYTPVEGEVITWSDLSASDFHAIPDALKVLGAAYYSE